MDKVSDLLHLILHNERTIVFGNLGRYPKVIYEELELIPHIQVRIISHLYPVVTRDPRIRVLDRNDPIDFCDLLIYIEPPSLNLIKKHPTTSHVVVFTSHFTFQTYDHDWWMYVCYFHTTSLNDDIEKTAKLLKLQDPSLQTSDPGLIKVKYQNVTITKKGSAAPPSDSYIIIDLTPYKGETLPMFLAFWDHFDYMIQHFNSIKGWVICFSNYQSRRAFDRFTQKCIDILVCRGFTHGNVTEIQKILSLIPFYKSGIIDKEFKVPSSTFGRMKIVIPENLEDVCKSSVMYDINHLTKNVYYIRE